MSPRCSLRRLPSNRLEGYAVASLLGVLLAATLSACSDSAGDDPEPQVRLTPITKFDAASVRVLHREFCDAVPEDAVVAAVGDVRRTDHYTNGETHRITRGVVDVSHEFNCTYVGERGDIARAWLFAPRVTPAQARSLVRQEVRAPGCRTLDGHGFGRPSTGTLCTGRGDRVATYRGLFVDAWLACALTDGGKKKVPVDRLVDRAGTWCVAVATSTGG